MPSTWLMSFKPLPWRLLSLPGLPVKSGCSMSIACAVILVCYAGRASSMQLAGFAPLSLWHVLPSLSAQCRPRMRWSSNGSFFSTASFKSCVSLIPTYVTLLRTLTPTYTHTLTHTQQHAHTLPLRSCHWVCVCEMLPVNLNCLLTVALNAL